MRHYSLLNRHSSDTHIWQMMQPIALGCRFFSFCGAVSHAQFRASIQWARSPIPREQSSPVRGLLLPDTGYQSRP